MNTYRNKHIQSKIITFYRALNNMLNIKTLAQNLFPKLC